MDVARYIGLYLLKNNIVYIHGLGNLEIRKKPASYDGANLQSPSYEVVLTPWGSIDDTLANFIAINEHISISKASNALREFTEYARAQLHAGQAITIPSIGSFAEEKGKITFHTDPHFRYTPPSLPSSKVTRREEKMYPVPAEAQASKVSQKAETERRERKSTGKIIGGIVVIIVLGALGFFVVDYLGDQHNTTQEPLIQTPVKETMTQPATPVMDTVAKADTVAQTVVANDLLSFKVILNSYTQFAKAERRFNQLTSYGNKVELVTKKDSSLFYVVLPVAQIAPADTAHLLDSLAANFNPTYGVKILEQQ